MKKLTKARIINWARYADVTIPFRGNTFLTGDNSSGKSTILDALQFCLTTSEKNFNKAGRPTNDRTVKKYVRGFTGSENKESLRSGHVTSYIAMEFLDEQINAYFTIGVKIDSPDNETSVIKKWFCVNDCLENISFITNNKPSAEKDFKCKDENIKFITGITNAEHQIRYRLGNVDEAFGDLFPKTISVIPEKNISVFINDFLLPKIEINIDSIIKNLRGINDIQALITNTNDKIKNLEDIVSSYNVIEENLRKQYMYEILVLLAQEKFLETSLDDIKNDIITKKSIVESKRKEINNIDKELLEANAEQVMLINERNNDKDGKLINEYERKLKDLKNDLEFQKKERDSFLKNISYFQNECIERLSKSFFIKDFDCVDLNALKNETLEIENKINICQQIDNIKTPLINKFDLLKNETEFELKNINEEISEIAKELKVLNKNERLYPEYTLSLKKEIEKEFQKRNIDSNIFILCDLIEIDDEEWRNAIEGCLGDNRFNIFVTPNDFEIAHQVYLKHCKEIDTVKLIDSNKFLTHYSAIENSLASHIFADNEIIKNYINFLLGDIICCNELKDTSNYNNAVAKNELFLHKNNHYSEIPSNTYCFPYIGKDAVQKQRKIKEERYDSLCLKRSAKEKEKNENIEILGILKSFNTEYIRNKIDITNLFYKTNQKYNEYHYKLEQINSDTIIELNDKISKYDIKIKQLQKDLRSASEDIGKIEEQIKSQENNCFLTSQKIKETQLLIDEFKTSQYACFADAEEKFQTSKKQKNLSEIQDNFKRKIVEHKRKVEVETDRLYSKQESFNDGNFGVGIEYIEKYINERDRLKNQELSMYLSSFENLKQEYKENLRSTLIHQLKEAIRIAFSRAEKVNKKIKTIKYGNDQYELTIKKTKDVEKGQMFDVIMSENNIEHNELNLFTNAFEAENKEILDPFIEKLSRLAEDGVNDKIILEEFLDFRNYIDCEFWAKNELGEKRALSKTYGSFSGGESQTPHYILCAAAISLLYNQNSINLIILDEAFNQMDPTRVESVIDLFKSLGLQVVLSAPPDKMTYIGGCMDSTLLVHRKGDNSFVTEVPVNYD